VRIDYALGTKSPCNACGASLAPTPDRAIRFLRPQKYIALLQEPRTTGDSPMIPGASNFFIPFELDPGVLSGLRKTQAILTAGAANCDSGHQRLVARGALEALIMAGLRVPEDVSVVGYDDPERGYLARASPPSGPISI